MVGSLFVEPVRAIIFAAAHLFGGNVGAGVLAVSFGVRLGFMPLTLRWARRAAAQRRILGGLVRWPFVAGIYGALRSTPRLGSFGWIADLARPSIGLSALVAGAGSLAAYFTMRDPGNERAAMTSAIVGSAISLAVLWHLSSAVARSWAANTAGDVMQSIVLVRERRAIDRASSRAR